MGLLVGESNCWFTLEEHATISCDSCSVVNFRYRPRFAVGSSSSLSLSLSIWLVTCRMESVTLDPRAVGGVSKISV